MLSFAVRFRQSAHINAYDVFHKRTFWRQTYFPAASVTTVIRSYITKCILMGLFKRLWFWGRTHCLLSCGGQAVWMQRMQTLIPANNLIWIISTAPWHYGLQTGTTLVMINGTHPYVLHSIHTAAQCQNKSKLARILLRSDWCRNRHWNGSAYD